MVSIVSTDCAVKILTFLWMFVSYLVHHKIEVTVKVMTIIMNTTVKICDQSRRTPSSLCHIMLILGSYHAHRKFCENLISNQKNGLHISQIFVSHSFKDKSKFMFFYNFWKILCDPKLSSASLYLLPPLSNETCSAKGEEREVNDSTNDRKDKLIVLI